MENIISTTSSLKFQKLLFLLIGEITSNIESNFILNLINCYNDIIKFKILNFMYICKKFFFKRSYNNNWLVPVIFSKLTSIAYFFFFFNDYYTFIHIQDILSSLFRKNAYSYGTTQCCYNMRVNVKCSFVCRDSDEIFVSCKRVCRQKIQTYPFFPFAYFEKLNIYLFTYLLVRTIRPCSFSSFAFL